MKILLCDDHALFRAGLRHVLRDLAEGTELREAPNADAALRLLQQDSELDLVLLDLDLPGVSGMSALRALRQRFPTLPVVIVSASERAEDVREALAAGAAGFIPKASTSPVLLGALRLVLSGGVYVPPLVLGAAEAPPADPAPHVRRRERAGQLTPRQLEILRLLAKGLTNREICGVLGIAEGTVKAHLAALFEALDVTNRTEAVGLMRELGLDPDDP